MNHLDAALDPAQALEREPSPILLPFVLGMAFNLASIAIGEPYPMALLGLVAALVATLAWSNKPLAWVIFVAVIAANPANPTTPIALNLFCGLTFLVLWHRGALKRVPRLVQMALGFVLLSMLISILASLPTDLSVPSIHTTDISRPRPWMVTWSGGATFEVLMSNVVPMVNFLLGPFLLIPLIFSRIRRNHEPEQLLKGLLLGLVVPTLVLFMLARALGRPILDATSLSEGLLNVLGFHLGRVDIQMIRTQVGIILAALICVSFAAAFSRVSRGIRLLAMGCLLVAIYMLMVTGSVGSTFASLAGILVILFKGRHYVSVKRYVILLFTGLSLAMITWTVIPKSLQQYATSRYELRFGQKGSGMDDRSLRWKKSFKYLMENPSGVGWSLYIEPLRTYPHNDYLSYAIAFGIMCGVVYFLLPTSLLFSFMAFKPRSMDPARLGLILAGSGATTVLIINSMSDHMTANRWYFNVVWSVIWYAYFASRAGLHPSDSHSP